MHLVYKSLRTVLLALVCMLQLALETVQPTESACMIDRMHAV